ncbi:MAG: UDP-N-acetylglucosamine 1-carboxyvinyltransferase [Candidatus Lernaella stagnicola]|nr:UDP-N-acetylglucosamine 1-carboxyvinyltransferase [Candidatus Lernaella stagnicola]
MVITGGERLLGEVRVSGAKNAALPMLCATILTEAPSTLRDVPQLHDIRTVKRLLEGLGVKLSGENGDIRVDPAGLVGHEAPYEIVKTMRAGVLILGPLVARLRRARVSLPGGCAIGARPVDQHLRGLQRLGAKITVEHGYIEASAPHGLRGNTVCFDFVTVGGTENLMMAAALAEGETVLENVAREPEITALADWLRGMGARIEGDGTDVIRIQGVSELHGVEQTLIADRIEAGTLMVAAGVTRGNILLKNAPLHHLQTVVEKLRQAGLTIEPENGDLRVIGPHRIHAVDVKTRPYPGFATDMQAQLMALACLADGLSVITETIFENRFMHVSELQRMGAQISIEGNTALVRGVPLLSGAPVMATDLRASASLVLAGLAADSVTEVLRIYHLDRGYERLDDKLNALGAKIRRAKQPIP